MNGEVIEGLKQFIAASITLQTTEIRGDISGIRVDISEVRSDIKKLDAKIDDLSAPERFDHKTAMINDQKTVISVTER